MDSTKQERYSMVERYEIFEKKRDELAFQLSTINNVFRFIWEIGEPTFNDVIPTACVTFNKKGEYLSFLFNTKFFDEISNYKLGFVFTHEVLHLFYDHGPRMKHVKDEDRQILNVALDIVVNETLVNNLNFIRSKVEGANELCFFDTVFTKKDVHEYKIRREETSHYYFEILKKMREKNQEKIKELLENIKLVDSHDDSDIDQEASSSIGEMLEQHGIKDYAGDFSKELQEKIKKELQVGENESDENENGGSTKGGKQAGSGVGGRIIELINQPEPKRKWEEIVDNWHKKTLQELYRLQSRFDKYELKNYGVLTRNPRIKLASEVSMPARTVVKNKLKVCFFLDISGSCYHLKDRFVKAALSLNPKYFDVELLTFDTAVEKAKKVGKNQYEIYGGGGTSFECIEKYIQRHYKKYPTAVWVMTDGWGDGVQPQHANRWFWFLTEDATKDYIPNKSKTFDLSKFE